jgi:N-acylneuraminate cytidylyltransferase
MKIIALLPMKGNSERVPNKNLKPFNGIPLYHHVLKTLLAVNAINEVVIDTDSDAIRADVTKNFKERVRLIDRPEALCGDMVSMNKIIEHDMEQVPADYYIQTHSTNPLLLPETLEGAVEKMAETEHDSIFSVTKIQTRLYDANGVAVNHDPKELIRTQDLPPLFEENSNFFIFTKTSFESSGGKRIGLNPLMYDIDKLEAIDIDEPQDFLIAETLHKLLR